MGDVTLRKVNHNKLIAILRSVKAHPTTPITYQEAVSYNRRAEELKTKLEEIQERLLSSAVDEAAVTTQESAFSAIEATIHEVRWKLGELFELLPKPAPSTSSQKSATVRLPSMDLPTFDGNPSSWMSFKDLFIAVIDHNSELAPSQKLHYLKTQLKGKPLAMIDGMTPTDANYTEAWKILKERYDNKREIVFCAISSIMNAPSAQTENFQQLQNIIDTSDENLRILKVLGQPVEHWDTLLLAIMIGKVDSTTRMEWAMRQTADIIPTLADFKDFISSRIRGLAAKGATASLVQNPRKERPARVHHATAHDQCQVCKGTHPHFKCPDFNSKSPSEKVALAKKHHLCFNCLSKDHHSKNCTSKGICRKCGKHHHTLLHDGLVQFHQGNKQNSNRGGGGHDDAQDQGPPPPTSERTHHIAQSNHASTTTQVLLSTAVVKVKDKSGVFQPVRVFLDDGSQATMITKDCVNRLGFANDTQPSSLSVGGISDTSAGTAQGMLNVTLFSRYDESKYYHIETHVFKKVTGELPRYPCKTANWSHIQGLQLADPHYYQPGKIDILIGAEYVKKLQETGLIQGSSPPAGNDQSNQFSPDAQKTIFGWVLTGRVPIAGSYFVNCHHVTTEDVADILKRFWEVEEPPHAEALTEEEKECEAHFRKHISRDSTGRFIAKIPFNRKVQELGLSREAAVRRFHQLERRLERNPDLRIQYVEFIREYQQLGQMEEVPVPNVREIPTLTYYIPHHCVINPSSKTTKLRVVFDGSAKTTTGVSLNDTMMVGPTVQSDLYDQLIRFRFFPTVLKADISKMFRQFRLNSADADYHRIVWRESHEAPLKDFRLLTVTYGTACAPYLATRCLKQLGLELARKYPLASKAIINDHYVDDLMSGALTDSHATRLYTQLTSAVSEAGMELRKWSSNSPHVMKAIPEDQRELSPHEFDPDHSIKALGVQWIPATDIFTFKFVPTPESTSLTKRKLLSDLARLFDPLGLISPVIVKAKLLLQELWKLTIEWDQPVPTHIQQQWEEYQTDLHGISDFALPRCVQPILDSTSRLDGEDSVAVSSQPLPAEKLSKNFLYDEYKYQLHGFSDASELAYGAVVYLRTITPDGHITVRMITSKTKVAPLRQVTLPRLELVAAVLLAELVDHLILKHQLECAVYLWSDSTITLKWIASQPRRWKTFVCNRVSRIQEISKVEDWRHVPGVENPADLASRGTTVADLINNSFWWNGPSWLSRPTVPTFPFQVGVSHPAQPDPSVEERTIPALSHPVLENADILNRFSSLSRLKRVTSFLFRFSHNCKKENQTSRKLGVLSPTELQQSLLFWIRRSQQIHFKEELHALKKKLQIKPSSNLSSLYPYLDSLGIMRITGRLQNADLPEWSKHQIILSGDSHLTELIIRHHHLLQLHSGFQQTWYSIQREYWVIRGRDRVRHFIRKCVICRRYRAAAAVQLMGNLPSVRITTTHRPFLHTGVDYAGPFHLRNPVGRAPKTYKGYLCIFVCMATKAIHLEAVSALTTEAFIATLRRFASRRGLCAHVYSDCGTNFIGAEKELANLVTSSTWNRSIGGNLATAGVTWHFNQPASPHQGGLWEAGVKSVKSHLRHVMGTTNLTFEDFTTVLCQIEAILNSRPLYQSSSDPTDFRALTPGHFLIGEPLLSVPDVDLGTMPTNRLSIFQQQQQRVQHFWKRWSREYINTLQQRNKWKVEADNMQQGDLVLLIEGNLPPGKWAMGRVVKVQPGDDLMIRRVTVKTETTELQRPVSKLVPLIQHD